ncbi:MULTISPECIES: hydrolase [unclassified Actinoplanes]|uniref:alpha/beta hydrolase family protein n=1 Tax=unclassified Actinoplanes TaxID=2626549 RepID=UPI001E59650A|nr:MULTISPECIES: hydrolase [unclassified Actinoplanes]
MRRTLAAVLAIAAAMLTAVPAQAAPVRRLVLPAATGHDRIGTVALHLVDRSRPDPWVPATPAREIMVQIWYPAAGVHGYPRADWVSPGVGARLNPPGSGVLLPVTHAYAGAPVEGRHHPVVLYSPGFGLERTFSTALVEELVSHGYVVVTIDHTHDAQFVEFPGGRIETQSLPAPTDDPAGDDERVIATALAARVADTRFTLDQLTTIARGGDPDAEHRTLPCGLAGAFDLSRVGMFGHSLGGASAAETMYEDPRVTAGVNLDGSVSGPVVSAGLDRPFLQVGSDGHGGDADETWDALWAHLRGPRRELELADSGHMSFTDLQVLLPQAGAAPGTLEPAFGTIDGERAVTVERAYLLAFFDRYLRHQRRGLLDAPSPAYPEMRFVR